MSMTSWEVSEALYPTDARATPTIMVEKLEQNFFIKVIVALMNPAWAVPNFHSV